jgi:hypothetical protein
VRDAQNNLVQGQTVDFQLTDKTGGSISVASAITDDTGRAQTVYTATTVGSTSNGVSVTATVQGTSVQGSATLTVGGQTVFLSLGTGNTITPDVATNTQFSMPFVVQALDSGGNAVAGVTVTLTVHSLPPGGAPPVSGPVYNTIAAYAAYRKGQWILTGGTPAWAQQYSVPGGCLNEDIDGTGIYELSEDLNLNGKLDPGDVAAVSPGSVTTNSAGSAFVNVTYPQDHAEWVQVELTATATVAGTQASTSSTFWLPMLAADLASATVVPPGQLSPYGTETSCANPN